MKSILSLGLFFIGLSCSFTPIAANAQTPTDIVVMMDLTGSTSPTDLELEKNAARSLINSFASSSFKPRISIGTFNVANLSALDATNAARILPGGELTANYGVQASGTGLFGIINSINSTVGYTDLSAAIAVAKNHLLDNAVVGGFKYIVIISDGTPNRPGGGSGPDDYLACGECGCGNAYQAASIATANAEASGIKIVAVHYAGNGQFAGANTPVCGEEPQKGQDFLKNQIATTPDLYFAGTANLNGAFAQISCSISCDDGNPCTQDYCSAETGACVSVPQTTDFDGDGVLDCQDQCRGDYLGYNGNDALLGRNCTSGVDACATTGTYACGANGLITCSGVPLNIAACFSCTNVDNRPALSAITAIAKRQYSNIRRLAGLLNRAAPRDRTTREIVGSVNTENTSLNKLGIAMLQSVSPSVSRCGNTERCVTVSDNARLDTVLAQQLRFKVLGDKVYSRMRKYRFDSKTTKLIRSVRSTYAKDTTRVKSLITAMPKTRSECS